MKRLTSEEINLIKNNLYAFYIYFVASKFTPLVEAPHIRLLSAYLTRIAYDESANNRLCVAMPPQHSKSSMVSIAYTVWLLCNNPNLKILVVNAEAGLSETFGIQIRQLLEEVAPLFGLKLSFVKSSKTYMMVETADGKLCNGEIRLVGSNGSITGHPADIIIVDDPYKGTDDIRPSLLQKKIDWFRLIIEQRIRIHTKLVLLHTRWHTNDLQGWLWENDRDSYDWLMLPAINENDEILWPQYYTREFYEKKRERQGEREFQALYQQKPLDLTSNFFYTDHIIWDTITDTSHNLGTCRSWDMAYTDEKNPNSKTADFTAGVDAYKLYDESYLFTDFIHGKYGKENINHIQSTARADGLNKTILIETGTKGAAAKELFNVWRKDYLSQYKCRQSEPWGTKSDRAQALADAMYDGKIHFCINDLNLRKTVIEQFKAFPNGEHDDIVDACSYAYLFLKDKKRNPIQTGGQRTRRRGRVRI